MTTKLLRFTTVLMIVFLTLPMLVMAEGQIIGFLPGEQLDFKVYFEFVLGGSAQMSVTGIEEIDGHPCYHIVSTASSASAVDLFYKVRDRVETWRDVEGGFTRLYKKVLREGGYKSDKRVEYFPEDSTVVLYRRKNADPEKSELIGYIQDVLSAFYDVRTRELEVDKPLYIDLHDIDRRYQLEVAVLAKETIEVPAGTFDCFVVEPRLQSSGLFRKEGAMQIWLTDDERHMPVLMKSQLYFGRVWAKLDKFQTGKAAKK